MRTLLAFLALSTAAAAQVTVTGKVLYEDRPYTNLGFGASVNRFVRRAEIQLLDSAGTTVLANGFTSDTGDYSLSYVGADQDVKIRVFARRTTGNRREMEDDVGLSHPDQRKRVRCADVEVVELQRAARRPRRLKVTGQTRRRRTIGCPWGRGDGEARARGLHSVHAG